MPKRARKVTKRKMKGATGPIARENFLGWRDQFLAEYRKSYVQGIAAAKVGISTTTVLKWRKADPEFDAACQACYDGVTDKLEQGCSDRAINGTQKPVHYRGELVDTYTEYDNRLSSWMLERRRPEPYHIKSVLDSGGAVEQVGEALRAALGAMDTGVPDAPVEE